MSLNRRWCFFWERTWVRSFRLRCIGVLEAPEFEEKVGSDFEFIWCFDVVCWDCGWSDWYVVGFVSGDVSRFAYSLDYKVRWMSYVKVRFNWEWIDRVLIKQTIRIEQHMKNDYPNKWKTDIMDGYSNEYIKKDSALNVMFLVCQNI